MGTKSAYFFALIVLTAGASCKTQIGIEEQSTDGGGSTPLADMTPPVRPMDMVGPVDMRKRVPVDMISSATQPPPPPPDGGLLSACGQPGDTGNSKGVGLFCRSQSDCAANGAATFCLSVLNGPTPMPSDLYVCSIINCAVGSTTCGENASCVCDPQGAGCGCLPDHCLPGN